MYEIICYKGHYAVIDDYDEVYVECDTYTEVKEEMVELKEEE